MELISGARPLARQRGEIKIAAVGLMAAVCFFTGRSALLGGAFPVGIALAAVFVSRSRIHFYLLPAGLLGMISRMGEGYLIWGDLAATAACAVFFLIAGKIRFAVWHKSVIAAALCIISNCCYYTAAHILYKLSVSDLWMEALAAALLCPCFEILADLADKEKRRVPEEAAMVSAAALAVLALTGIGQPAVSMPAIMLLILYLGYTSGVMGGIAAGFIAGVLTLLGNGGTAELVVFLAGGMTAGFSRGQNRFAAGACFAAASMAPGLLDLGVILTLPYEYSLTAAAVFALLPKKWIKRGDIALSSFLQKGRYSEKEKCAAAAGILQEQKKVFDRMAAIYASPDSSRAVVSYQFRGMSQITGKLIQQMEYPMKRSPCKYRTVQGVSDYARGREVSGDSCIFRELSDGRTVMVISDGMGKGRAAAAESSLVVSTIAELLDAGVEIELILRMVNSILLLNREAEIFSTVDMGVLDRHTGKMKFYKIGAAPTLIKRKNKVEIIKMDAMPMGIVDGLAIDYVTVNLQPGDQVVMMSDGIMDSRREDLAMEWLIETVKEIQSKDPQTMSDLIVNKAVENYGDKEKDDLTVLTVRVS